MDENKRRELASSEAAEWCARLQDAGLSRAEREQFVDWLRESPLHVAEMLRMAMVDGGLRRFDRWDLMMEHGAHGARESEVVVPWPASSGSGRPASGAERSKKRYRLAFGAVAGLALLVLGVGVLFALRAQIIQTGPAERQQLALMDGSVVLMDPETRLRLNFDERERRVTLERGRALFHVAKNPARPFVVETRGTLVRAVGTAFAVERQNDDVVVTVAEGRVAVSDAAAPGTSASQRTDRDLVGEFLLGANQQITVAPGASGQHVRTVNSERALSWAQGRLVFDHQAVSAVVAEFNRYNRIQLRVEDPDLAQRPVSGVFEAADPESFIAFMQTVARVRVDRTGDREITMGSGR